MQQFILDNCVIIAALVLLVCYLIQLKIKYWPRKPRVYLNLIDLYCQKRIQSKYSNTHIENKVWKDNAF